MQRALIVEDDPGLRRSLRRALVRRFPSVRTCGTRAEAEALIADWRPQLVLLDVMLPDGDAFDVLREAARSGPVPEVVAMSGNGRASLSRELREAGVVELLVKPLTPEALQRALDAAVSRFRSS